MPLKYDDVPGSWRRQSDGWPAIYDPDGKARALAIEHGLVPYGSYVSVGQYLRVENLEYFNRVVDALNPPRINFTPAEPDPPPNVVMVGADGTEVEGKRDGLVVTFSGLKNDTEYTITIRSKP